MKINWEVISDASTAIGVFVALAGVVVTLVLTLRSEALTRKGQQLEREQAEASAARSEAAARLTEDYTRRVVEALETMATHVPSTAGQPLNNAHRVRWSLEHHRGDSYILTNLGEMTARDVQLSGHESLILRPPPSQDVGPDGALTFIAARSMATRDSTITVQWADADTGEERTWKYPLPPK